VTKPSNPGPRTDSQALEVERLLRQLQRRSGGAVPPTTPTGPAATTPPPPRRHAPPVAGRRQPAPGLSLPSVPGVWARIALGALLGAALTQWPYAAACGAGLALKVAGTAVVAIAGIWAANRSWRRRMPAAHITALLILAWGLALLTHEVLPRTRYWADPAPWQCSPATRALTAPPPFSAS
jgi:hypothetical protein